MTIVPTDDVVALLTQDHEAIRERLLECEDAMPEDRAALFWELTVELIRHEVAEEVVIYPALRNEPTGADVADARRAEEAAAEKQLAHMEKLDPTTEEFVGALRDLRAAVLTHAAREEAEVFPLLLAHDDGSFLDVLGQKIKGEKLAAPTHPHPHAPNSALGHKIVGPIGAFIDRMRDAAREHSASV
jgi:hypothetical protein